MEKKKSLRERLSFLDPFTYVDKYVIERLRGKPKSVRLPVFILCLLLNAIIMLNISAFLLFIVAGLLLYYFYDADDAIDWAIYLFFSMLFAYIIFAGFGLLLSTKSPMVIVVSGSMEPTLYRGDIVVLQGISPDAISGKELSLNLPTLKGVPLSSFAAPLYALDSDGMLRTKALKFNGGQEIAIDQSGDIVVYYSPLREETIIHRVVAKLRAGDGVYLITKGDNRLKNNSVDQDCGAVMAGIPEKANCISLYPVKADTIDGRSIFKIPLLGYVKIILLDDIPAIIFGCRNPYGCQLP